MCLYYFTIKNGTHKQVLKSTNPVYHAGHGRVRVGKVGFLYQQMQAKICNSTTSTPASERSRTSRKILEYSWLEHANSAEHTPV